MRHQQCFIIRPPHDNTRNCLRRQSESDSSDESQRIRTAMAHAPPQPNRNHHHHQIVGRCLCCSTTHRCQQSQQPHTTRLTMPHHAACRPSSRPLCFTALLLSLFSACVTEIPLVSFPARFLPFLPWGGGSTRPVDRDTLRWQLQPPSLSLLHLQPFMPLRHRQQRPQAKSIPHVPARLCTACCSVYHHRHAALVHRRSHQPAAATYAELVPAVG